MPPPTINMATVPTIDVGMIVTPGRDRRAELRKALGIAPTDKVVYFYIGRYGQENLGWARYCSRSTDTTSRTVAPPRRISTARTASRGS